MKKSKMKCIVKMGLILMLLKCAVPGYAQDISVANARVIVVKEVATLMITVKNSDSVQLKTSAELYIDFMNDSAKVISQIQLQTLLLKPNAQQLFQIPVHAFRFNAGYSLKQVKKIVVLCDPHNKIKESNEGNNVHGVADVTSLLQITKKQKMQSETQF